MQIAELDHVGLRMRSELASHEASRPPQGVSVTLACVLHLNPGVILRKLCRRSTGATESIEAKLLEGRDCP